MGGGSCSEGCGFASQRHYWMDICHITLLQNCPVFLEGPKINEKEARVGPFSNLVSVH